jgi:holo-[acyl-carrier protein] synthase
MILGIGIDLVKVSRIGKLYCKYGNKFVLKILSPYEVKEITTIKSKNYAIQYLAKRFVAKEALVKAIGTGFGKDTLIRDITIKNDNRGKPYYYLSNELDDFIKKFFKRKYSLHLSISDDKKNAIANAVIDTAK